jgi:hypothetical protein
MLDTLASLSRRRWVYVVAAMLTTIAVVGPAMLGSSSDGSVDAVGEEGTSTTSEFVGQATTSTSAADPSPSSTAVTVASTTTTTAAPVATTTTAAQSGPSSTAPSTTVPPATTTTSDLPEVDRAGDDPNPGALYPTRRDQRPKDRERAVGLDVEPARFSGYSVWVAQTRLEQSDPNGNVGPFLVVTLRVVNRDDSTQPFTREMFLVEGPDGIAGRPVLATPWLVERGDLPPNGEEYAELWFRAPNPVGEAPAFVLFRPDADSDRGVWAAHLVEPSDDTADGQTAAP